MLLTAGCGRGPAAPAADSRPEELVVFAAASLRDALAEVAGGFEAATGTAVVSSFAASNVLARQLEAAPAADVFLSADERWMDALGAAGRLVEGSRRTLLSNRLVIVANRLGGMELAAVEELAEADFRYLAIGDPEGVPAGRYARSFLEAVEVDGRSLWQRLEARIVPAADVRAALHLVEAETDVAGIVYRTDAATSALVRVVLEVPEELTPPIRYAVAAIDASPSPDAARAFLGYLESPEATAVFERHGFLAVP